MVIAAEAVYENGVLKLKQPLPLEDKAEVRVTIETTEPATAGADAAEDFVGFIKNAPAGVPLADEHDRYLYGDRRR